MNKTYKGLRVKYKNYTLIECNSKSGNFKLYFKQLVLPNGELTCALDIPDNSRVIGPHTGRNLKKMLKQYVDRLSPEQDEANRVKKTNQKYLSR